MRSLLLLLDIIVGASCHLLRGHSALPRARQEIVLLLQLRDELALLMRAALRREVSRLARAEQYACLLLLGLHLGFVQKGRLLAIEVRGAFEGDLGGADRRLMAIPLVVEDVSRGRKGG